MFNFVLISNLTLNIFTHLIIKLFFLTTGFDRIERVNGMGPHLAQDMITCE